MCGIAGIIDFNETSNGMVPAIHRMTRNMKHRGPDDEGYLLLSQNSPVQTFYGNDTVQEEDGINIPQKPHIESVYNQKIRLAFGHRRLKIIDMSFNGHQPMGSKNYRYWIIFNGEIYNYKEIREDLKKEGFNFSSNTDTEVVLATYEHWGVDCLQRFNGMFAFAIYDNLKNEVFLARDRIGIKPLYYTRKKGLFVFASDIKTIIASGLYQPEVNLEGLWHNLSFSVTPRPMTMFKDVFALQQATWMNINLSNENIYQKQYWNIPIGRQDLKMTEYEAVELLEEQLKKSIQYRLTSDVKIGTFMSGGIDSTTISALASGFHPKINAFTLAFDKKVPEYDELDQAIETAERYEMFHIIKKVKSGELLKYIDDMVIGYEEPYCSLAPNYLISKCISDHGIVVALNGLGGDELFAGYSYYLSEAKWRWKKKISNLLPSFKDRFKWNSGIKTIDNYYVDQHSNYKEYDKKKLLPGNNFDTFSFFSKSYKPLNEEFSDNIEALSYYDIMSYIGNHHVYRTDQFMMRFSLEGRFPLLDHQLIELAFRIPSKYKLKNRKQKYVLRKVAEKYIPKGCLEMPKRGFGLPVGRWMKDQLKHLTKTSLENLKKRDIFDKKEIDNIYLLFKSGKPHLYKKTWHLVMTELWFQHFIDKNKEV